MSFISAAVLWGAMNMLLRCGMCLLAEGKYSQDLLQKYLSKNLLLTAIHWTNFLAPFWSVVSKNLILTAMHWNKTNAPQLVANWNSGKHCAACHHARQSAEWIDHSQCPHYFHTFNSWGWKRALLGHLNSHSLKTNTTSLFLSVITVIGQTPSDCNL